MAKYCPNCGALSLETDNFCLKCGINFKENPPISISPQPRKSYSKIIGASLGVIFIIIVIVLLFLLSGGNGIMGETSDEKQDDDMNQSGNQNQNEDITKLLGEWNIDFENYSGTISINDDNTLDVEYLGLIIDIGTWSIEDEEICLVITQDLFDIGLEDSQCFSYSFSDDDNTLTLSAFGLNDIVLTK